MQEDRPMLVARISAERFASTDLAEVCEWLQELQHSALRLDAGHLPRAVLCTLWLLEDIGGGGCLVAGTLRFVRHPTASNVRLSFEGLMVRTGRGDDAALQLLDLIASSILGSDASQTDPVSAAG